MRWVALYTLLFALLISCFVPAAMAAEGSYEMMFIAKNDRTVVPYRYMAEFFGNGVSYMEQGAIARVVDEEAQLSDEELYEKYAERIRVEHRRQKPQQKPAAEKEVFLTFDDGPNEHTARILDILENHRALATFFMLKGQVENFPGNVKRMHGSGHALGTHGVTHDAEKTYRSPRTVVAEMEACNDAIEKVVGVRTALMRVPYGSKPWMPKEYRDVAVNAGYRMWDWNVDSGDSRTASVAADLIVNEIVKQVTGKKQAVVLMHDRKGTVEALPRVIRYLKENGYVFKRIESGMVPMNFWGDER